MRNATIGLDVGGTKILALALELPSGRVVARKKIPTPQNSDALVDTLFRATLAVGEETGLTPSAVGVGIAGLIDTHGVVRTSPNLPEIRNLSLRDPLSKRLGLPVALDNDTTAAAVAEARLGAAKGMQQCVYAAFGTGIGGGLVINGQVYRGANGFAAEIGHMVVDPNGPLCGCGQKGCWEQLASGSALGRLGVEAHDAGRFNAEILPITGEYVGRQAQAGNPVALELLDSFSSQIALGLANLTNLMDPEIIVVGGGVMEIGDLLLDRVRERYVGLPMGAQERPETPIANAYFGADSGAIGAALLAADLFESD